MKKFPLIIASIALAIGLNGCAPRAEAFLIGSAVGVGATCMFLWGNVFCQDGSQYNSRPTGAMTPLWYLHDPYFPDASVPYDMP